eukprot:456912_1
MFLERQKRRRSPMEETLVSLGFQKNYIGRAFKVYEKNYGFSYNIEVMTEIIVRLQNKDKLKAKTQKRNAADKESQPSSSPRFKPKRPAPSAPPRFKPKQIVLYNGIAAEIHRIRQDGLIEITYPTNVYVMKRNKATVNSRQIQTKVNVLPYTDMQPSQPISYNSINNNNQNISNRHQYQKAPQIQQSKTSDDNVDNIPPFVSHLTLKEASKLRIHDKIDHRDQVGRFVFGTISEKKGTNLKIHYDGWMSKKWDTWSDFSLEIHRFARADSISKRPAHRFRHLKKGDYVDINPTQRHPGWKCGEIRRLDQKSGQIQVVYEAVDNKNYLYWAHLDNVNEIAEFTAKSGTVVDKDNIKQDEKWNPPDLMPESVQISDSNYIDAYISNTFEYCHQSEASYTLNILEIILNLQI